MITILVLIDTLALFFLVAVVVMRSVLQHHQIIGKPPVPVPFFLLAKILVIVNLAFLLLKGLDTRIASFQLPWEYTDIAAVVVLIAGTGLLFITTFKLDKDLVFGLSTSEGHKLKTNGVYALSRHPFYLGFILVLFSSCLFSPHYLNILSFAGAWIIHHFIMIREEQFLVSRYGDEYRQYAGKVKRYISF